MQWALKPRMFTWEANAKSPTFSGTWDAENQIGCALPPGIWPKPWKAIGRDTRILEAIRPWPPLSSIGVDKRGTMPQPMFDLKTSTTAILTDGSYIHRNPASTAI